MQFPAQRHFSAYAVNCQESNPRLRRNFLPPSPINQTLRWPNAIFTCIWNHSVLQNGELPFCNGRNSISRYFFSKNPKCRFILFQYTNVYNLRQLRKYCRYWLQNFTVTLFQLYAKDDFNASLQWCRGFSHCKITAAKSAIKLREINMNFFSIVLADCCYIIIAANYNSAISES